MSCPTHPLPGAFVCCPFPVQGKDAQGGPCCVLIPLQALAALTYTDLAKID